MVKAEIKADVFRTPPVRRADSALTAREIQVLALIAGGKTSKEIAAQLGIAFKTAVCHRSRILTKLAARNTADLTRYAIGLGLASFATGEEAVERPIVHFCVRRQELTRAAEGHLRQLASLAHAQAEALLYGHENVWRVLDQQITNKLRDKDQILGKLRQHEEQHGC